MGKDETMERVVEKIEKGNIEEVFKNLAEDTYYTLIDYLGKQFGRGKTKEEEERYKKVVYEIIDYHCRKDEKESLIVDPLTDADLGDDEDGLGDLPQLNK